MWPTGLRVLLAPLSSWGCRWREAPGAGAALRSAAGGGGVPTLCLRPAWPPQLLAAGGGWSQADLEELFLGALWREHWNAYTTYVLCFLFLDTFGFFHLSPHILL
ncbi:unnamed protein product [Pipistrellus nathusii]|uniref:Uncharacterized protein n=1 Tax=Pipistrellus nathusii TaxID=59473 RepID=A0ABP0A9P5_PIPNA